MSFVVISHTAHICKDGKYYGWGPTIAELNFLSTKFDDVVHIAPVVENDNVEVPASFSEVNATIRMVPVLNRGGTSLTAKFRVLSDSFNYISVILRELKSNSYLIHVRCPANISLIALMVLFFFPKKRKWIKYAGDWKPRNDFFSYKLQRFIIRYFLRNHIATINGYYPDEKEFIHYFLNPSFTLQEVKEAAQLAEGKELRSDFFRIIFVGSLEKNKGADVAIKAFRMLTLHHAGEMVVIGDGSEASNLSKLAVDLELKDTVRFEGWKNREEIKDYYAKSHFIILPSQGEGWPKVISEAMAYGIIPIVSDVSSVRYTLSLFKTGSVANGQNPEKYEEAILEYLKNTNRWMKESKNAVEGSYDFALEVWWDKLNLLIRK